MPTFRNPLRFTTEWCNLFEQSLPILRRMHREEGDWLVCETPQGNAVALPMWMSKQAALARRVLETLANGGTVSFNEAIRLRSWAVRSEDIFLLLVQIDRHILDQEENPVRMLQKQEDLPSLGRRHKVPI